MILFVLTEIVLANKEMLIKTVCNWKIKLHGNIGAYLLLFITLLFNFIY